jgi:hypothetical protein
MSTPTVITLMAAALDAELQTRGIFSVGRGDCEAIMAIVLERSAAAANKPPLTGAPGGLPRRCETNIVNSIGDCIGCGAIQGEACLTPRKG